MIWRSSFFVLNILFSLLSLLAQRILPSSGQDPQRKGPLPQLLRMRSDAVAWPRVVLGARPGWARALTEDLRPVLATPSRGSGGGPACQLVVVPLRSVLRAVAASCSRTGGATGATLRPDVHRAGLPVGTDASRADVRH